MKTLFQTAVSLLFTLSCLILLSQALCRTASVPQVKAIFFHKADCPECMALRQQVLPTIMKQFGDRLTILSLDTSDPNSGKLYLHTLLDLRIPFSQALPIVIIDDQFWGGATSIENHLPDAIAKALSENRTRWPALSGLDDLLNEINQLSASEQKKWFISADTSAVSFFLSDIKRKFNQDIAGNTYAVIILIGMLIVVCCSIFLFLRDRSSELGLLTRWLILVMSMLGIAVTWQLAEMDAVFMGSRSPGRLLDHPFHLIMLIGMVTGFIFTFRALFGPSEVRMIFWQRWALPLFLGISIIAAGYLAYMEFTQTEAVCGAVGDCNAVQQSPYASLFGYLSIAGLGILANGIILVSWILIQIGPPGYRDLLQIFLWVVLLAAVVFFIYLTFLEPFVIGATCFWCLTAAAAMTLQLLIATQPASTSRNKLFRNH